MIEKPYNKMFNPEGVKYPGSGELSLPYWRLFAVVFSEKNKS